MEHDARLHRLLSATGGDVIRFRDGQDPLRGVLSISACSQALLAHYGIDPSDLAGWPEAALQAGIEIREVQSVDAHLTMTIIAPMPWSGRPMTIATGDPASVRLPGMTLSPSIAAAAIGRPLGRLAPHPALDRPDLLVTAVEHDTDGGVNATILHFQDAAMALPRTSAPGKRLQ